MKQKIVLYGTGLEGERFYWKYKDEYEIVYCIDRNCHRNFHGIWVYGIDEVKDMLKEFLVIIAAINEAYIAIEGILKAHGMREFENYLGVHLVGRKLAILYGNCHMAVLEQYFVNNPWFEREYTVRRYYVAEREYPSEEELFYCRLFIGQDIREGNQYDVPSMDALMRRTQKCCTCIKIPNLFGYNLFWPQIGSNIDCISMHLNETAVDIDRYSNKEKRSLRINVAGLSLHGDVNIERMYREGRSIKDIANYIRKNEVYAVENIRKNFEIQIDKIKKREKMCDIQISDYIEQNYQNYQLFYDLNHPTELLICEKGRRILQLLNLPQDEAFPVGRMVDYNEIFIYGCVKKALGITYEQRFIRRGSKRTLMHRAVDLEEYVEEYIAWRCKET